MKLGFFALGMSAVMVLAACNGSIAGGDGSGGDGGSGGSDTSVSTTTATTATTATTSSGSTSCPSYASDVAPILDTYCGSCHGPGGQESDNVFDTYATASAKSSKISSEVNGGKMPPKNATSIPSAEKAALLAWIACGSPDN